MKISKGIGIDLGTTNSCVAVMDLTDSQIIMHQDKQGVTATPSCVWHDPKKDEIVVGKRAFRQRGGRPEPIVSIKRAMGTNRKVKLGGQDLSPEQVSAEILKDLRQQIEETIRAEMSTPEQHFIVDRAIITIPAYFQLPAIEATRKAGELAGLEIIELLHEPTAAAVHYAWKHKIPPDQDCTFLVFDPGGGTFDVSILRRTAGEPEVLGVSGDTFLGGDDLDRRLAELIRRRLVEEDYDLDLDVEHDPEDALRLTRLVLLAEGVKKRLTDRMEELLRDSNTLTDKNDQRVVIEMMITRGEFENEIRDLLNKMVPKCWEAMSKAHKKAGTTLKDIDYILLVGGTSYVPLVQETARVNFCNCADPRPLSPKDINDILDQIVEEHRETACYLISLGERAKCQAPIFEDPDTCNARGAAIRAALAGLAVYNDQETVRVIFRGQGATASAKATIAGRVEMADAPPASGSRRAWRPLDGGRIVVELAEAGFQEEEFLDDKGNFRFRNVPLQAGAVNQFNFQVYDGANTLLATVGRPIAQSKETVAIGAGVLTTAVLPTPIRIEGLVGGRIAKEDLIPETTSLPAEGHFTFYLEENPGYVVIPIYQGNRLIKEIKVEIDPALPAGTPIAFHITIDEKAYIVCKGNIDQHEFAAAVEPPKVEVPSQEEIAQKLAEFEEALAYRNRGDQAVLKAKAKALKRDIDEARESGDEPKIIERFEQLCALVDEAKNVSAALEPPKDKFDKLVQTCLQLVRQLVKARPKANAEELEKNIRTQQQEGDRAAQNMDQQAYGEAYQMLIQYAQGLQGEIEGEHGAQQQQPPTDPATQAAQTIEHFRGVCAQLKPFAAGRAKELEQKATEVQTHNPKEANDLRLQARSASEIEKRLLGIERDLVKLQPQAKTDPENVLRQCQVIQNDLARIYDVLQKLGEKTGATIAHIRIR